MLVADHYQKQGLGSELLQQLIQIGKDENLDAITAEILHENRPMQRGLRKAGLYPEAHPPILWRPILPLREG